MYVAVAGCVAEPFLVQLLEELMAYPVGHLYEVAGDLVAVLGARHLVPDSVPVEQVYVRVAPRVMGVEGTGVTGVVGVVGVVEATGVVGVTGVVVGVVGIEIVPALVVAQT